MCVSEAPASPRHYRRSWVQTSGGFSSLSSARAYPPEAASSSTTARLHGGSLGGRSSSSGARLHGGSLGGGALVALASFMSRPQSTLTSSNSASKGPSTSDVLNI